MQYFSADVLVLRAADRGENDKLLTLLSAERGKFYAILKGAHSMRRRELAATEPFTLSNMEFYEKGGVKWVKTAVSTANVPSEIPNPGPIRTASIFGSRSKISGTAASDSLPSSSGRGNTIASLSFTASMA